MELLRSGADVAVIALWLGHERVETTSRIYLHADMSIKQRALDRTTPSHTKPGRYRTLTSCSPSSTTSDYGLSRHECGSFSAIVGAFVR